MENENYINIQGWMRNELGLKANELILYAIIHGFSQDGESEYYGSQRYISKSMGVSLQTANSLINKLLNNGLIIKTTESHYSAVFKKLEHPVQETRTLGVQETRTNNNNTNNNSKGSLCSPSESKLVPIIEKAPGCPQTYWRNKKREAVGKKPTFSNNDVLKQIHYFKDQAMSIHGQDFNTLSAPSGKMLKGFKSVSKFADLKDIVDWWLREGGEYADYTPDAFISESTVNKFKAKKTNKKNWI